MVWFCIPIDMALETAITKRPLDQRVYTELHLLADSVTVGLFVYDHETFVRKFEDYGHALNPSLQALNFGIDGYNPDQIYELLRSRVMQFEPNKVVYVMCLNDFDLTDASGEKVRYYRKPYSFVIEELRALFTPRLTWDARDSEEINNNVKYHIWHYKKNKMHVFDKIREMRDFLHAKAISFEVVVVPVFRFSRSNEFTDYPFMTMHHQIDDFLGDNNIDFLDLINAFSQQSRPGTLLRPMCGIQTQPDMNSSLNSWLKAYLSVNR